MKRLLTLFIVLVTIFSASAQLISFRTTAFSYKEKKSYGWTNWSKWENSNMLLTMNLSTDIITIYSPTIQYYKIIDNKGSYIDEDGDGVIEYKFIDQDGDYGTMKLMQRKDRSEIYIIFNNVIWVYTVIRI